MYAVLAGVRSFHGPTKTLAQSHRRETLQMPRMFQGLCTLYGPKAAHAHTHRREALQMLAVLKSVFSVWQFADSFAYPLQGVLTNEGSFTRQNKTDLNCKEKVWGSTAETRNSSFNSKSETSREFPNQSKHSSGLSD